MKIAYSTLACPGWTWRQAIDTAQRLGYDGVEWRLVDGAIVDADFPLERAAEIGRVTAGAGLGVPALDTSVRVTLPPGPERDRAVADTGELLRLAAAMGAPFLRVFPGVYPESVPDADALDWATDTLLAIGPAARDTGVAVALELHDSFGWDRTGSRDMTCSRFVAEVLRRVDAPWAGVQWDVGNPFLEPETVERTWANVAPRLLYLQIKDMVRTGDGGWRYVPVGEGELPIRDILDLVGGRDYPGWVSFEWEKKWHPELAEPDTVLPGFLNYVARYR